MYTVSISRIHTSWNCGYPQAHVSNDEQHYGTTIWMSLLEVFWKYDLHALIYRIKFKEYTFNIWVPKLIKKLWSNWFRNLWNGTRYFMVVSVLVLVRGDTASTIEWNTKLGVRSGSPSQNDSDQLNSVRPFVETKSSLENHQDLQSQTETNTISISISGTNSLSLFLSIYLFIYLSICLSI